MRVAVVTGAGRGLGRAHARALAERDTAVVVNDMGCEPDGTGRDASVAEQVTAEIIASGGQAVADTHDVASMEGGAAVVRAALDAFERVDILVNNAGIVVPGDVFAGDDGSLDRLLGVHLKGPLGAMAAALPGMLDRGWGRIVNTVSEVAFRPGPAAGGYAMAKAAVWSATLSAAEAVRGGGVTVNAVSPGAATRLSVGHLDPRVSTEALDPSYVSRVVAWLASDEARDVNGSVLHVAAGQVREYRVSRLRESALVERVLAAVQ